jgi:hypothetical protein
MIESRQHRLWFVAVVVGIAAFPPHAEERARFPSAKGTGFASRIAAIKQPPLRGNEEAHVMAPTTILSQALLELLARKGFDEAAIDKFEQKLIRDCPWFSQPPGDEDDPEVSCPACDADDPDEAEKRYHQLEAVFLKHGLSLGDLFEPEVDEREWDRVFERVFDIMESFGVTNELDEPDFWVVEDFYGSREILVEVVNQELLSASLRTALRQFLKEEAATFTIILRKTDAGGPVDEVIKAGPHPISSTGRDEVP